MQGVYIKIILFLYLLPGLYPGGSCLLQNNPGSRATQKQINWHSNITGDNFKSSSGWLSRVFDRLTGMPQISFSRPVAYLTSSNNSDYILCQKTGKVLMSKGGRLIDIGEKNKIYRSFPSLIDGCILPGDKLLFTDSFHCLIYRVSDGQVINIFNSGDSLNRPTGIAYSPITNTIWVAESGSHRLSEFTPDGDLVRRIGTRGTGPLEFNFPAHLCIDREGYIYVIDAMNFRVQILDSEGNFTALFGSHGDATGKFARPKGIAVDSNGNIFIVDALFNAVQVFNRAGELLYYFGNQGSDNGEFILPSGITIDENDYIYVSDTYNNRIQVFEPGIN